MRLGLVKYWPRWLGLATKMWLGFGKHWGCLAKVRDKMLLVGSGKELNQDQEL